jgi:adenosine kinase
MSALICGSIAYDNIMVFEDRFKDHILPDQIHILNVSFLVPTLRKEFGGCAGNIAYNLRLLGGDGYAMATVGADFGSYRHWLDEQEIDVRYITEIPSEFTAQAYITTDLDDNQITAFHPGAMNEAHRNNIPLDAGITIGMVSPDGRDGMIEHANQFSAADIPFVFDPGQGLPMFGGDDLRQFIDQATWVAVNDYESQMLQDRTGWSAQEISEHLDSFIVTRGAEGSYIYTAGDRIDIPAAKPEAIKDPTGCGDAYRAGLLFGLMNGLDWDSTGRLAGLLGAIKVANLGTQNHHFTRSSIIAHYEKQFGVALDI